MVALSVVCASDTRPRSSIPRRWLRGGGLCYLRSSDAGRWSMALGLGLERFWCDGMRPAKAAEMSDSDQCLSL